MAETLFHLDILINRSLDVGQMLMLILVRNTSKVFSVHQLHCT